MYSLNGYIPAAKQVSLIGGGSTQAGRRIKVITPGGPAQTAKKRSKTNKKAAGVSLANQTASAPARGKSKASKAAKKPKKPKKAKAKSPKKRGVSKPRREGVTVSKGKVRIVFVSGKQRTLAASTLIRHIPASSVVKAASSIGRKKKH